MTIIFRMLSHLRRFPLKKIPGDNNTKNALTVEKIPLEKVPGDNNQKLILTFELSNCFLRQK